MSIWDMFRSTSGATGDGSRVGAGAITPPAAIPGDPSKGNSTVPGDNTPKSDGSVAAIPKAAEGDKSPLEGFKDLWETPIGKDGKPIPAAKTSIAPTFNIDPKKMLESARGIDFKAAIDTAVLDKASKGDSAALSEVINQAAQAAYAQASVASTKILETALTRQAEAFESKIMPEILRKHNISNALRTDNPLFDNPAVAPMLNLVETQFASKFPNASATEITQKAKEYLGGFATELLTSAGKVVGDKPTAAEALKKSRGEPQDWSTYFGVETAA